MRSKKSKPLTVAQKDDDHVPAKILATSIRDIGAAYRALDGAGLNRKCQLVLLSHSTGLSQATVTLVLNAMRDLERTYLK